MTRDMDNAIRSLGPCEHVSPLRNRGGFSVTFKTDNERVLFDHRMSPGEAPQPQLSFEVAGPREQIFFNPAKTTAGIVTCGGLCPGLNDIIRGIVTQLHLRYAVTKTYGFRYGYEGLVPRYGHTPIILKPENVSQIHSFGGSIIGTSRGPQDIGRLQGVPVMPNQGTPLAVFSTVSSTFEVRVTARLGALSRRYIAVLRRTSLREMPVLTFRRE